MPRLSGSVRQLVPACLAVSALLALVSVPAESKNCEIGTPAFGVESALWGTLKPADGEAQLPDERDSSNYDGHQRPDDVVYKTPLFTSIEIENGWIFQTYTQGIKIWDATGANARSPVLMATRDCQTPGGGTTGLAPLLCLPGQNELRELFWDVDAPDGQDSLIAVASAPLGLMIWDTSSKGAPRGLYQDYNLGMSQVWSATIGGRNYAFAVADGATVGDDLGIRTYDMTTAAGLNGCVDQPGNRPCGVFKGRIGSASGASYIDGLRRSDGKTFIAVTNGANRFEIWDVSNPLAPVAVTTAQLGNQWSTGTAIWEQGGKQFVAVQYILPGGAGQGGRIYDVTSCLNGNCAGLSPIWNKSWNVAASHHFVTHSTSGGKHFLYWGNEDKCSGGLQREWLFDVSNLAIGGPPVDLTPPQTIVVTAGDPPETATVDYWSWYYASNPKGFSEVMPRMGKVNGNYFYRAAWTLFDVHELTAGIPPSAEFSWSPTEVYPGMPVTFTAAPSSATSWSWTFPGPSSASGSSTSFTFQAPGSYPVTLDVSNAAGPGTPVTKNVPVLDAAPAGGTVAALPNPALVCQDVGLDVSGVTGKPPLTYTWEVLNDAQVVVDSGGGSPSFTWDNTGSQPAGNYTGRVTINNSVGPQIQRATAIALDPLPALQFTVNPPSCTNCTSGSPPAGTAAFSVQGTGATRWRWYFNGQDPVNGTPDLDTTDPAVGPSPSYGYTSTGSKTIRVRISNCVNLNGILSDPLTINITQINPLVISGFAAICPFGICSFGTNEPITFDEVFSGDPTSFEYDWDGNPNTGAGGFEQVSQTAVLTHAYPSPGDYVPRMKIVRGIESVTRTHATTLKVSTVQQNPPSISISGPSSGKVGDSLGFTAFASNCTPSSTWSWTATGVTVSGSGSSVNITFSSTGIKSIQVTNSGCGSAVGSTSVNVTEGGGGPGPGNLSANFTYSPASPVAGQVVTFTDQSTGSPTIVGWSFGDGESATGSPASHTYASAGTYIARLDVSKPGCPDQLLGLCTATISKTLVVGSGGPPPLEASINTTAECVNEFGLDQCTAKAGDAVSFTAVASGATTFGWNFGDGGTASGAQVSHTWTQPGSYEVRLTVGDGKATATAGRRFVITGTPTPTKKSVVLPWLAQTKGALDQSSDLYVHNPGTTPMEVTLELRKKGLPEANPPQVKRTIQPGATFYSPDVLNELFNRENIAGFIRVTVETEAAPVINSFNTTFQPDGKEFGQSVGGRALSFGGALTAEEKTQHLVGLIDSTERLAYFGITNPNDEPATYHLRFFDKDGLKIGESATDLTVSRFGQQQFQVKQIHEDFGVSNEDDYRVEIETKAGGRIVPYGSNLRLASEDPSFIDAGASRAVRVFLVGALSSPGLSNTLWQSDALLANTSAQPITADMTFTGTGLTSVPTSPLHLTLAAGTTERLENVIASQWGIHNGVGVLTILTTSAGAFPIVQGESYENTNPAKRFGQTMMAVSEADAAVAGKKELLVGLRQDAKNRTTFWLFNPGTETGEYDVVYRALDGTVLGTVAGVRLGGGKLRQFPPGQHPLPAAGVVNGFTVQVVVKSGKALAAAQVVNNLTSDPAYIRGEVR